MEMRSKIATVGLRLGSWTDGTGGHFVAGLQVDGNPPKQIQGFL